MQRANPRSVAAAAGLAVALGLPASAVAQPCQPDEIFPAEAVVSQASGFNGQNTAGRGVVTGEFNNDGNIDAVFIDFFADGFLSVLLGNGDGTFTGGVDLQADLIGNSGARDAAVADFDLDGNNDLAVGRQGTEVLLGNGDGTFGEPFRIFEIGAGDGVNDVDAADLNQDGNPDVISADGQGALIIVSFGDGEGGFGVDQFIPAPGIGSVEIADFDGDGVLDLVSDDQNAQGEPVYTVRLGSLSGPDGWEVGSTLVSPGANATQLVQGDFNGDGNVDLASASFTTEVPVSFGNGDGTFQAPQIVSISPPASGSGAAAITVGDYNADGNADFVTPNFFQTPASMTVALGDGMGGFQDPFNIDGGGIFGERLRGAASSADVDNDGDLDVVAGGDADVIVQLNYCGQTPPDEKPPDPIDQPCDPGSILGSEIRLDDDGDPGTSFIGRPEGAALGDVTGDGVADAVVMDANPDDLLVLAGSGDGTFAVSQVLDQGDSGSSRSPVLADLDNDGDLDIVSPREGAGDVVVFLNNGNGTFQSTFTSYDAGEKLFEIITADVNGDGDPDVITANRDSDDLSLLLGDGAGGFEPTITLPNEVATDVEEDPSGLAFGDVDNDGNGDIVVANLVFNEGLTVLTGNGDGTFNEPAGGFIRSGDGATRVELGDLDGDGNLDAVTGNLDSGNATLLFGRGDGSFRFGQFLEGGGGDLEVRDFTGNGILDIAIVNGDEISLHLGNGDGTFPASQTFTAGDGLDEITPGDIDGDGRLDLMVMNDGSEDASVLLNECAGDCPADLNGDGEATSADFLAYIDLFAAGDPEADLTGDGQITSADFLAYIDAFAAGCP